MEREKKSNEKNFGRSKKISWRNRFTKNVVDSVSSGLSTDGISASRRKLGENIAQRQQNINLVTLIQDSTKYQDSNFDNYVCLINFACICHSHC